MMTSLTDRQKNRREEIIEAALNIFYQKGFYSMKIEEVAQAAGIGKGTVYEYFRSKEELMAAAIEFEFSELEQKISDSADKEKTLAGKLAAIVCQVIRHQQTQKDIVRVSFQEISGCVYDLHRIMEMRQRRFMDQFSVMIDEAAARGEIRPVNPRILMGALMGALFGLSRSAQGDDKCKFFFDCRDMEPERIGREVSDLIIYGLARRE